MQKHKILLYVIMYLTEKIVNLCDFEYKMNEKEIIRHDGIVERIGADSCHVRILQASACSSCSARQLCRSSESKEKLIEVRGHYPTLQVGEKVTLSGSVRQGLRASFLAYILPLVLMLIALFWGTHLGGDGAGALAALLILILYYGILYLLRDKLSKSFSFEIVNYKNN